MDLKPPLLGCGVFLTVAAADSTSTTGELVCCWVTGQNRTLYKQTRALGFRDVRANEPSAYTMLSGPTTKRVGVLLGHGAK